MLATSKLSSNFYKKNWINNCLWRCCFSYLIAFIFITPIYKFGEVYLDFPSINLSAVRAMIMLVTFFFLLFRTQITKHEQHALRSCIPAIITILIVALITIIAPFYVFKYSIEATKIYLMRVDNLVGYIMMFLMGFYFDYQNESKYKSYFFLMWLVFGIFMLVNVKFLLASFFYYDGDSGVDVNYIQLSECYVILSIFTITLFKNKYSIFLIWAGTLVVIFFLPSRANTVGFILASVVVAFTWRRMLYGLLLLPLLLMMFNYTPNTDILEKNRVLSTDISDDESLQVRQQIERDNIINLKENWLFGDFMGDVKLHKGDGFYTHNILSRWQEYSLFYLIFFLVAIVLIAYMLIILSVKTGFQYHSTLMLAVFSIPVVLFLRGPDFTLPYFVFARTSVYFFMNRMNTRLI